MEKTVEIKKCEQSDLNRTAHFYGEVMQHLVQNINYPKWTPGVYPCRESIAQVIDAGEQYIYLCDNEVLGAFVLNDNPQGSYFKGNWSKSLSDGDYLVIHTLATHPTAYKTGIGKKMVEFCINHAKQLGYKAIRLDVVPTNIPAKLLYERLGFSFAGEFDLDRGFENIPTFLLYELNFN